MEYSLYRTGDRRITPSENHILKIILKVSNLPYSKLKNSQVKIDCDNFAAVFQKALDILLGSSDFTDTVYHMPLPEIPKENLHLFEAASTADVFGAMGSWNDSPPYMANEKGMEKEYEFMLSELLKRVGLPNFICY